MKLKIKAQSFGKIISAIVICIVSILNTSILQGQLSGDATLEVEGEVNRMITSNANLLPYAYGTNVDPSNPSSFVGTDNFTAAYSAGGKYIEITFNDTEVDYNELTIHVTPKDIYVEVAQIYIGGTQARIRPVPIFGFILPNKFRVYIFDINGNTEEPFFSFIAYKKYGIGRNIIFWVQQYISLQAHYSPASIYNTLLEVSTLQIHMHIVHFTRSL